MSHHRRTQPHSHIDLGLRICVGQVDARRHKLGRCKAQGHCWVCKADEAPTIDRKNNQLRNYLQQLTSSSK